MTEQPKGKLRNNQYCLDSKKCCVHKMCGADDFMECCPSCEPNSEGLYDKQ